MASQSYPTAGSSMLSTWNNSRTPVNMPAYQGPVNQNVSEAIFRRTGASVTPTGISSAGPRVSTSGGSVLGASTGGNTSGGGSASGSNNNQQTSGGNPFDNIKPSGPSREEIDAQFNPILDVYNRAESTLRGQIPGLISEAEAQAAASRGLLQGQKQSAEEKLAAQEMQTGQQRERQTAQQRQTLQELQQANLARFGASGLGGFASELQGREYQRNVFGINEQAQNALMQINQSKMEVEREYSQGIQQLEVNRQSAINQINRDFQNKLLEIASRRGETESAKANARMNALQELRNAAYQIDLSKAQFEAQLRLQAQQNLSQLNQVESQFSSAAQTGQGAVDAYGATPQRTLPAASMAETPQAQQYTGQISNAPMNRDELLRTMPLQGLNSFQNLIPSVAR